MNKWVTTGIAGALAVGTLLAWVGTIAADNADTKRRVETVEKRQEEDRRDTRQAISEVNAHAKVIDQNVQIILQKLTGMEAEQRAERRASRK